MEHPHFFSPGSIPADLFPDNFLDMPTTINPEQLQHTTNTLLEDLDISSNASNTQFYQDLNAHDSGVDLRAQWAASLKQTSAESLDHFLSMGDSPMATQTPSPAADLIFSQSNSPHNFIRDQSSVSSTDGVPPPLEKDADLWNTTFSSDAILIPQSRDAPHITLVPDRTKTRAETQIKMRLTLDPLDNVEHIRFPRKTLAKPKQFASDDEKQEIESKGGVVQMKVNLVCATAIEDPQDRQRALRRAAGTEEVPRRPEGVTLAELDKDHPSHPQNGGEVLICEGCKERERKRYDRKKKRGEDEEEFSKYDKHRVIMINEKEHKKLKEVEPDGQFSSRARQVEFAMRITCYCRHQEEKTPVGYCVIFTFIIDNAVVAQHVSDIFHITDDHKNKELTVDTMAQPIPIPQYGMHQYHQQSNVVVPMYQYGGETYGMNGYSQPTTPILASQFTSPISPMDTTFSVRPSPMQQPMVQPMPQSMAHSMPQPMTQPLPQQMPQSISQQMPQAISQQMPQVIPQQMPQAISQQMPQSIPQHMPQSIPQQLSQQMPQQIPQQMPQQMPQPLHSMGQGMSQPMPTLVQQARQPVAAFPAHTSTNSSTFSRHQRGHSYYETPMLSPSQMGFPEPNGLPRPQSMDNFNFTSPYTPTGTEFPANQYFSSAPTSTGGTPINLSRPASPTWDHAGPPSKKGKTVRCVYFYVDE